MPFKCQWTQGTEKSRKMLWLLIFLYNLTIQIKFTQNFLKKRKEIYFFEKCSSKTKTTQLFYSSSSSHSPQASSASMKYLDASLPFMQAVADSAAFE